MSLDIAFSDHRMALESLQEFGEVIRSIRRVCEDDDLRFWSFISFVSGHHPAILQVELSPEAADRCAEVLAQANPPPVIVRESWEARMLRDHEGEASDT